jgi:hypothetical protein
MPAVQIPTPQMLLFSLDHNVTTKRINIVTPAD